MCLVRLTNQALNFVFDEKRAAALIVFLWTAITVGVLGSINVLHSDFMTVGPSNHTMFMTVAIDTWHKWWILAAVTFLNAAIGDFMGDAIAPWIQNTVEDHKTRYIPYSKLTCYLIIQIWSVYCAAMHIFSVSLLISQIDFLLIRLAADLAVNTFTTHKFLRNKSTDPLRYRLWGEDRLRVVESEGVNDCTPICDLQLECVQPLNTERCEA